MTPDFAKASMSLQKKSVIGTFILACNFFNMKKQKLY